MKSHFFVVVPENPESFKADRFVTTLGVGVPYGHVQLAISGPLGPKNGQRDRRAKIPCLELGHGFLWFTFTVPGRPNSVPG